MILKEFSDYIKSREALAEAFSESAERAEDATVSAGAADSAGFADPTNATSSTKPTDSAASNTDNSGVFNNSAGEDSEGSKALTDPTKAMKTTKSTDATSTEIATDSTNTTTKTDPAADPTTDASATDPAGAKNSANDVQNIKNPKTEENREAEATGVFREAKPPQNSNATDSAGIFQPQQEARSKEAFSERQGAQSATDIQNTEISKRDKFHQNHREAPSATDSGETRGDSGQEPVSRGVLQQQNSKFSCVKLLNEWLVKKLRSVPISNIDKIICNELFLATNKKGATLIIAKRESGRKLLRALYNFSLSYEHYRFARRTHEVRPSNFTNRKD